MGDETEREEEETKRKTRAVKVKAKGEAAGVNSSSGNNNGEDDGLMEEGAISTSSVANGDAALPLEDLTSKVKVVSTPVKVRESRGKDQKDPCCSFLTSHRMSALLVKNFIRMWRNIGFLIFQFIIPTVQVQDSNLIILM